MTKRSIKSSFDDLIREKTLQADKKKRNKRRRRSDKSEKTLADLMGQPPLLSDEDPAQYFALYQTLRLKFEPRDILEEFYVRQVMDDAWLVIRYRRMNSHILNRAQPNLGDEIRLKIDRYRKCSWEAKICLIKEMKTYFFSNIHNTRSQCILAI